MAYILWNRGEQSLIHTWLVNHTAETNSVPGSQMWVGMGSKTLGVGSSKTTLNGSNKSTTLAEIGQVEPAGYERQPINRNGNGSGGWPTATLSGSYQTTAPQVAFTFTGTPDLTGATLWFVALGSTIAGQDCLFGADLAATRNFSDGDTERITITYRQT